MSFKVLALCVYEDAECASRVCVCVCVASVLLSFWLCRRRLSSCFKSGTETFFPAF